MKSSASEGSLLKGLFNVYEPRGFEK